MAHTTQQSSDFKMFSPAFVDQGMLTENQTCTKIGKNLSPELSWTFPPANTKTFALVCNDPDAPSGNFIHWIYFNLPASVVHLEEGTDRTPTFPNGSQQGINSFGRIGYDGPCPPPGKPHHYIFTLYALDTRLNLDQAADFNALRNAMKGHILGQIQITGLYQSGKYK